MINLYRDKIKDVLDSNFDYKLPSRNNYLQLSKPSIPPLQMEKVVPLLFKLFGNDSKTLSKKRNNLKSLPTSN